MIQRSFTAQELICMARLRRKRKIYGIPDVFSAVPQEYRRTVMQNTYDTLLEKQIAVMDFDRKTTLSETYDTLVDFCCDCGKCLTVNNQRSALTNTSYIFWQWIGTYQMAEVVEDQYVFSQVDASAIKAFLADVRYHSQDTGTFLDAVIPQIALTRAKRACKSGNDEDAIRILRQNGAEERLARVITDGLHESACYIDLMYMDNRKGVCQKTEKTYLSSRGAAFSLGETVVNLRSCVRFTETDGGVVQSEISDLVNAFLEEGQER